MVQSFFPSFSTSSPFTGLSPLMYQSPCFPSTLLLGSNTLSERGSLLPPLLLTPFSENPPSHYTVDPTCLQQPFSLSPVSSTEQSTLSGMLEKRTCDFGMSPKPRRHKRGRVEELQEGEDGTRGPADAFDKHVIDGLTDVDSVLGQAKGNLAERGCTKERHRCWAKQTRGRRGEGPGGGAPGHQPGARRDWSYKRGNSAVSWTVTAAVAHQHNLDLKSCNTLADLATAAFQIQDHDSAVQNAARSLISAITGPGSQSKQDSSSLFKVDSLDAIAARVQESEEHLVTVQFVWMLNLVQFVAKIEAIRRSRGLKSAVKVIEQEQKQGNLKEWKDSQLEKWKTAGSKFAALAGAGELSFYLAIDKLTR
jgi:hypothetical protein